MIPAFGLRSSGVPEFPAGSLRGRCAVAGPADAADSVVGERYPSQVGPGVKRAPLLTHYLLTRPILASACGHDQVPQVDRCGQLSVILPPRPGLRPWSLLQGRVHAPRGRGGTFVAEQYRNHLGAKPAPLLTHCLLTRPIPASACGHDQVSEVDGSAQVPVMPGPQLGRSMCVPASVSGSRCGRSGCWGTTWGDSPGCGALALSVLIACRLSISALPGAGLGFPRERPPTPGTRGRHAISTWGNRAGR